MTMNTIYLILGRVFSRKGSNGAVTVEYVFAMIIAFIALLGVLELFRAMSIEILSGFSGWVAQPYP